MPTVIVSDTSTTLEDYDRTAHVPREQSAFIFLVFTLRPFVFESCVLFTTVWCYLVLLTDGACNGIINKIFMLILDSNFSFYHQQYKTIYLLCTYSTFKHNGFYQILPISVQNYNSAYYYWHVVYGSLKSYVSAFFDRQASLTTEAHHIRRE